MLSAIGYELRKHHFRDVLSVTKLSKPVCQLFCCQHSKNFKKRGQYFISQLCSLLSLYSVEGRKKN